MKPAVWSRVTATLAREYGISYKDAKFVYDRMRETGGKPPSLRAVAKLPNRLPKELWNPTPVKAKKTPAESRKQPAKSSAAAKVGKGRAGAKKTAAKLKRPKGLPSNVNLAPPAQVRPPGVPVKVPKRQAAKTEFAQMLKTAGLPVKAILDTAIGEEIDKMPKAKGKKRELVAALKKGFKELAKNGGMENETKDRISDAFQALVGDAKLDAAFHSILKQMYGKPPVQPNYSRK